MTVQHSILVVEDSPTVQQMIKIFLDKAGYTVRACTSTEAALEILRTSNVDLVLCDIVIESKEAKTGYHILKHIRAVPRLKHIPVFMMTDQRSAENAKVTAHRLGANGFLPKPFKMEQLDKIIKKSLSTSPVVQKT